MVVLSFWENVKNVTSRLLPTEFMEAVEETTQPQFPVPLHEGVLFLCNHANNSPETVPEIVRALRRRIGDDDPKVQFLVLLLLSELVRNGGLEFHAEVAAQKGLLRDVQNIATRTPCVTEKMRQAKEAALTLILNLSIWFTAHPDGRLYILTKVADDVRQAVGPNVFEGIQPDPNAQIAISRRGERPPSAGSARHAAARRTHPTQTQIVDAIGVNIPQEEQLAAMLDVCMTLAEYINNLKVHEDGRIPMDDVLRGFRARLHADHSLVSNLLSSDLQLPNRDVLRDVLESQSALLTRLATEARGGQTETTNVGGTSPPKSAAPNEGRPGPDANHAFGETAAQAEKEMTERMPNSREKDETEAEAEAEAEKETKNENVVGGEVKNTEDDFDAFLDGRLK